MSEDKAKVEVIQGGKDEQTNQRMMRAIVIGVQKEVKDVVDDESSQSQQLDSQVWAGLKDQYVEPPLDLLTLSMLRENNSELGQVIDAMEVNIDSFGHRFVLNPWAALFKDDDKVVKEVALEKIKLVNFFNNAAIDTTSFVRLRRDTRRDIEGTGNGYWEVITNASDEIVGFKWAPSHTIRLYPLEQEAIEVETTRTKIGNDGKPELTKIKHWKRFRKFVQVREAKKAYFKELGDPRVMDSRTGLYQKDGDKEVPLEYRANSMIHFRIPVSRSPYGLPRYIGNLFSIFGSRAAEEINYVTLKNNNIPSLMLLISGGGMLTGASIKRIEEFVETNIRGKDNYSKILLVEAEPIEEGALPGQSSDIKMSIERLSSEQIKDAMYQEYDKNNIDKVRSSFRLPPIFTGRSEDYTRATADTSKKLADEQVFAPERNEFDSALNTLVMPLIGAVWHMYKSNSPNVTDNQDLIKMLGISEKTGGMTPQIARDIMSDVFSKDLGDVVSIDPDVPFTLQVAEAAKNTGPINLGTVAATKSLVEGGDVLGVVKALRIEISKALKEAES